MSLDTQSLILKLAASARPVRPMAPPMARALIWLGAVCALGALAVFRLADLAVFARRASDPRLAAELAATLTTGLAGVIAAFHLSLPDRSRAWAWLPAPFAALWLALSGVGCWRNWAQQSANGWRLGESADCLVFLLAVGAPLAALLLFSLRRARPLQPGLTAAIGAAGVAGLAAFLLQFFHPFDVTLLDLGVHLGALAVLALAMSGAGARTLAG
jgi:hypothetical protein